MKRCLFLFLLAFFIVPASDAKVLYVASSVGHASGAAAPNFSSATINGTALVVNWDESCSQGASYANSHFNLDMSTTGSDIAVTYQSGSGTAQWSFTAASAAVNGETVDLDFDGTADSVENGSGIDLGALSSESVTNNTPAGGPTPDIYWDATSGLTLTNYTDGDTVTLNNATRDSSGLLVDAANEYATIPYTPSSVASMTIEIVFDSTTTTPDSYAALFTMGSNGADLLLRVAASGFYHDYSDLTNTTVPDAVYADYWDESEHTIRIVWNSTTGTATLYLDGVQDGQDAVLSWAALTSAGPIYIGNRSGEGWEAGGYIKSFKLWEQAVTP